jgi:hypothetical protein
MSPRPDLLPIPERMRLMRKRIQALQATDWGRNEPQRLDEIDRLEFEIECLTEEQRNKVAHHAREP